MEAFDSPREVQVIVDAKDDLYISVGTFGFVSFKDQEEQLGGMKLPLKCWIHTHPFGQAFFVVVDALPGQASPARIVNIGGPDCSALFCCVESADPALLRRLAALLRCAIDRCARKVLPRQILSQVRFEACVR